MQMWQACAGPYGVRFKGKAEWCCWLAPCYESMCIRGIYDQRITVQQNWEQGFGWHGHFIFITSYSAVAVPFVSISTLE